MHYTVFKFKEQVQMSHNSHNSRRTLPDSNTDIVSAAVIPVSTRDRFQEILSM